MRAKTRILVGDHKAGFLKAAGDLMADKNWEFVFVTGLKEASDSYGRNDFSAFVANLQMFDADKLSQLGHFVACPIICICENTTSAELLQIINSDLNVIACLADNASPEQLTDALNKAVYAASLTDESRASRKICEETTDRLRRMQTASAGMANLEGADASFSCFVNSTVAAIAGLLENIHFLANELPHGSRAKCAFESLKCPRADRYEELLWESVQVLEETKSAFKSRQLAELRRNLQHALVGNYVSERYDEVKRSS